VNISPHSLDDMSRQDSKCHRGHQVVAMKLDRAVAATCGSLSLLHPKLIHRQVSFSSNAYWCSRADICAWRFLLPTYTHHFLEMPQGWKSTKTPSVLRDCSNTRSLTVVRRVTTSMEYKLRFFSHKEVHSIISHDIELLNLSQLNNPHQLATALTEVHFPSHSRLITLTYHYLSHHSGAYVVLPLASCQERPWVSINMPETPVTSPRNQRTQHCLIG
jgi:hypothetical protein